MIGESHVASRSRLAARSRCRPCNWPARAQGTPASCSSTATAQQRGAAQQAARLCPLERGRAAPGRSRCQGDLHHDPAQPAERSPLAAARIARSEGVGITGGAVRQRPTLQPAAQPGQLPSAPATRPGWRSGRRRTPPPDESDYQPAEPEASQSQSMKRQRRITGLRTPAACTCACFDRRTAPLAGAVHLPATRRHPPGAARYLEEPRGLPGSR